MKRSLLAILMLLLACSFAFGQIASFDDYVLMDVQPGDNVPDGGDIFPGSSADIPFLVTHQCTDPGNVTGLSLGFAFTANAAATWAYTGETLNHNTDWFSFGVTINSTAMPNAYLLGGASIGLGIPLPTIDELFFTLHLDFGPGEGQMCVDSAFFPPAGAWKFSNTTCDPFGGPRPYFVDQNGSDANHPICVDVLTPPCLPPTINVTPVGDELSGSHCNGLAFTFGADPGSLAGNPATPLTWAVNSGPGGFVGADYSVGAMSTGTYPVEIQVTNSCGQSDTYMFDLVFTNQNPSITNCGSQPGQVGQGNTYSFDFNASDPNSCDGMTWSVSISGSPTNAPTIDGTGFMSWDTEIGEAGTWTFTVTVDDGEGGSDDCVFDVEVLSVEPFEVQLEKVEDQYQGQYGRVSIFLNKGSEAFGGFDFLISYDASALTFMGATLGAELIGKWEYFTYRYGWNGNCSGGCPSGMLRVIGIADVNNGPYHPPLSSLRKQNPQGTPDELVSLTFYVTNDRTFECMFIPIRFIWFDCGDNAISSVMGDTLWISRNVYNLGYGPGDYIDITGQDWYGGHWWLDGQCVNPNPDKPSPIPFIDFINGGVDIACADSIDARGDLNLNNVANEIADVVLYTNYFIYGIGVFNVNPDGQIAASDVNNDGRVLTVGDLVYLVRIVTGDALPYPKLSPFANNVTIEQGSVVKSSSQTNIGAALFVFDGEGEANLLANGMKMKTDIVDGQLRVLVWSDGQNYIPAGDQELVSVTGDLTIVEADISDYYGNLMNSTVVEKTLPTAFSLNQNYPNPFNPTTNIIINLPTQQSWKLDIYNVAGQLVKSFSGNNVGEVTVTWDASGVASGIYFYKATAGQYTDTKKMVLMK